MTAIIITGIIANGINYYNENDSGIALHLGTAVIIVINNNKEGYHRVAAGYWTWRPTVHRAESTGSTCLVSCRSSN